MSEKQYFLMAELAPYFGKKTETLQVWLRRQNLVKKLGGRWVMTRGRLLSNFPEVYQQVVNRTRQHPPKADTLI